MSHCNTWTFLCGLGHSTTPLVPGSQLPTHWGQSSTSSLPAFHWSPHLTSSSDSSPPRGHTGSSEENNSRDGEAWNCTLTLQRFLRPLSRKVGNQPQGCPVNLLQTHQTPYLGRAGRGTYDDSRGLECSRR